MSDGGATPIASADAPVLGFGPPAAAPTMTTSTGVAKVSALRCISFFPCSCVDDFLYPNPSYSFKPLYVHFFFPDECIVGWSDCCISIFFTPDTLDVYIEVRGQPSLSPQLLGGGQQQRPSASPSPQTGTPSENKRSPKDGPGTKTAQQGPAGSTADAAAVFCQQAVAAVLQKFDNAPFPGGLCRSRAEFIEKLSPVYRRTFTPIGVCRTSLSLPRRGVARCPKTAYGKTTAVCSSTSDKSPNSSQSLKGSRDTAVHVHSVNFVPNDVSAHHMHRRIEWLLHFFIDACSSIEYDPRWKVLLAYVKRPLHPSAPDDAIAGSENDKAARKTTVKRSSRRSDMRNVDDVERTDDDRVIAQPKLCVRSQRGCAPNMSSGDVSSSDTSVATATAALNGDAAVRDFRWELVGFASLYKFFALPRCRRRVSQFFVLPTFQACGVGLCLLEHIQRLSLAEEDVMEFAVEDPAHSFKQLRDVVSLKLAIENGIMDLNMLYPSMLPLDQQPADEVSAGDEFEEKLIEVYRRLRGECKESRIQATRLISLIRFCKLMPHPLPSAPVMLYQRNVDVAHLTTPTTTTDSCNDDGEVVQLTKRSRTQTGSLQATSTEEDEAVLLSTTSSPPSMSSCDQFLSTSIGRDWRPFKGTQSSAATSPAAAMHSADVDTSFASSDVLKEFRIGMKRSMRTDNIEWLGALKPAKARQELDSLWQKTYASFYRTAKKLRTIFAQF